MTPDNPLEVRRNPLRRSPDVPRLVRGDRIDDFATITPVLERIVRRHPSCWVLNYNFFSNRPFPKDLQTLKERDLL